MSKRLTYFISISLFLVYSVWWLAYNFGTSVGISLHQDLGDWYADTYGILALVGAFGGFVAYQVWGSYKSYLGRSLLFFSLGLLGQFVGQLTYTLIYRLTGVENAYPSFGEVFFISSVLAYILAVWYLAKSSGFAISLTTFSSKIVTVVIPLFFFGVSYLSFLKGYDTTDLSTTEIFLDYFYPIFQAIFVSLAIATYYVTRRVLGGVMKKYVLFTLAALVTQYVADSVFIYRTRTETWMPGGISDYFFVVAYFLMTMSLLGYLGASEKLRKGLKGNLNNSDFKNSVVNTSPKVAETP